MTTKNTENTAAKAEPTHKTESKARSYGRGRFGEGNFDVVPQDGNFVAVAKSGTASSSTEKPAPARKRTAPAKKAAKKAAKKVAKATKATKAPAKKVAKATKAPAKKAAKSASTAAIPMLRESTVDNPVKTVWRIADSMKGAKRKDVIAKCVASGVAFYTARTQYQLWKAMATGGSSN